VIKKTTPGAESGYLGFFDSNYYQIFPDYPLHLILDFEIRKKI
jgi:hypothetical protein